MVLKINRPQYYEGTIKTRRLENEGHKIRICTNYFIFIPSCQQGQKMRICTKYYTFIGPCLYVRLDESHIIRSCTKYYTFIPPFLYAKAKK
jgi:hypothetical protein